MPVHREEASVETIHYGGHTQWYKVAMCQIPQFSANNQSKSFQIHLRFGKSLSFLGVHHVSSCFIMVHPLPPFFSLKSAPRGFPRGISRPPRANLGAAQQAGADLHRRGAQQQRRGRLPRVAQTARGDHRDLHGVHDLRQQCLGQRDEWQNGMGESDVEVF